MRRIAALLVVTGALLLPAQALAQVPGYGSMPGASIQTNVGPSSSVSPKTATSPSVQTAPATQTTTKSSLPFTGLEVGIVAAAGLTLLGIGFTMRKLSARRSSN